MQKTENTEVQKSIKRRKPAAERKIEIVEMAIKLAAEVGPDRLTTEVLARKIGISQAAIFRHFKNKGAIWEAVALRLGEKVKQNWSSGTIDNTVVFGDLKHLVLSHLSTIQDTPALPAILFSRELHAENENLRLFFVGMIQSFLARLTSLIEVETSKLKIDSPVSAEDAASLILSIVQGLALRWSLNANSFDLVKEGARLLDIQLNCILSYNQEIHP